MVVCDTPCRRRLGNAGGSFIWETHTMHPWRSLSAVILAILMALSTGLVSNADDRASQQPSSTTARFAEGPSASTGTPVTLVGAFPAAGLRTVRAQVWLADQQRWSATPSISADSTGKYRIRIAYQVNVASTTKWRAQATYADGTTKHSETVQLRRTSGLTVNTPASVRANASASLTGRVAHAPGTAVRGQVWLSHQRRWSNTASVSVKADGTFNIPLTYRVDKTGTTTWRVAATYASGGIEYSNSVKLIRTPRSTLSTPRPAPQGVSGVLIGKAATSAPVQVRGQVWIPSQQRWSSTPARTSKANGSFSVALTYQPQQVGTTRWRAQIHHKDGSIEYTNTVAFSRVPRTTVSAPTSVTLGATVRVTGRVSAAAPVPVWAEVWVPAQRRWSRTPVTTTNAKGAYTILLNHQKNVSGTAVWRVGVKHANGNTEYTRQFKIVRTVNVDPRCLTGRVLCASKSTRKMHWMIDGRVLATVDVRFGKASTPTREGTFTVYRKSKNHVSGIFGTPMPFSMFFSGGQAVHYSDNFRRVGWRGGSAGCINVRDWNTLARMFNQVKIGDKVVVYR